VLSGGLFHGIQLWVNLPRANKWNPPHYQSIEGKQTTLLSSSDGGALVRVIAGDVAGHEGPGSTFTPITMIHATLRPGAQLVLPWRADFNALVYSLSGRGTVGAPARPMEASQLALLGAGDALTVAASEHPDSRTPDFDVLILGGLPIREPVAHYGPFVMNTKQELVQAFEDFQAGKMGVIPAERVPHTGADEQPPVA
jgi:redox-sensitive bicupin YhaK (pirin superfamily)